MFIFTLQILFNEKSRCLDQCLISCLKDFAEEATDLIILPILLDLDAKRKSTLLTIINCVSDIGKNYILR